MKVTIVFECRNEILDSHSLNITWGEDSHCYAGYNICLFFLSVVKITILTDIIIPLIVSDAMPQLVRFEVRLHVCDLDVRFVWVQGCHIHVVRVFYYHYVLKSKAMSVEVLWKDR